MKYLTLCAVIVLALALAVSCKQAPKDMSLDDFLKIQNEIIKTDLTPEAKDKVVTKYGYTLKQYDDLDEKVKGDPKLQEKLGEIRLNMGKNKDIKKEFE